MAPRIPPEFIGHFMAFPQMPIYRGICTHVVDGDTFDVLTDLGFNDYRYITVRLRGVDTPEVNSPDRAVRWRAFDAWRYTISLILGKHIVLQTYKDSQTFGRYIANVSLMRDGALVDLAGLLREAGHTPKEDQ